MERSWSGELVNNLFLCRIHITVKNLQVTNMTPPKSILMHSAIRTSVLFVAAQVQKDAVNVTR